MKVQVISGRHIQRYPDGTKQVFKRGDVLEIEDDSLLKKFRHKFRKVDESAKVAKVEHESEAKKPATTKESTEPKDVTDSFSGAADAELMVKKIGTKFSVFEAEDLDTPLEGGEALTKKKAEKFIADYAD